MEQDTLQGVIDTVRKLDDDMDPAGPVAIVSSIIADSFERLLGNCTDTELKAALLVIALMANRTESLYSENNLDESERDIVIDLVMEFSMALSRLIS